MSAQICYGSCGCQEKHDVVTHFLLLLTITAAVDWSLQPFPFLERIIECEYCSASVLTVPVCAVEFYVLP